MNTAQLSLTLLAAWHQRDRQSPWGRRVIAGLAVSTIVASATLLDGPLRWLLPTLVLTLLIHTAWLVVGANLMEQNHPTSARCVPGHVAALGRAGLLGWLACAGLGTLVMWAGLPAGLSLQSVLLGNALAAAFTLWALRIWWLWLVLAFYAPLLGVFQKQLAPLMQAGFALWQAHTDSVLAAGLVLSALLVQRAFGQGDARHRRHYARQARMRQAQRQQLEGKGATPAQMFTGLERLSRPFSAVLDLWFGRLMARADNASPASVMARAELVLHGNQHWTYQLLACVCILGFVALSLGLVVAWTGVGVRVMLEHGAMGMGIGIASMAINPTLTRATLYQTRHDQALLVLLPGMPQGARLNRTVAWLGLRHAGIATALVAALLVPLARTTDQPMLLWLPLVAVPCALWTATRSPARMRPPTALATTGPVLLFYVLGFAAFGLTRELDLPMAPIAAAVLVASALFGMWRWRRLDAQPAALPAGRLS